MQETGETILNQDKLAQKIQAKLEVIIAFVCASTKEWAYSNYSDAKDIEDHMKDFIKTVQHIANGKVGTTRFKDVSARLIGAAKTYQHAREEEEAIDNSDESEESYQPGSDVEMMQDDPTSASEVSPVKKRPRLSLGSTTSAASSKTPLLTLKPKPRLKRSTKKSSATKKSRSSAHSDQGSDKGSEDVHIFPVSELQTSIPSASRTSQMVEEVSAEERLVPFIVTKAPPDAFAWNDLLPGTTKQGQRGRSELVTLMTEKLISNPFSYLFMKKNLRIVASNMSRQDLESTDRKNWKGPFYVQSGGQHVRGVQEAMQDAKTALVLSRPEFRPKYDLYGGLNMQRDLWQRLVTETQVAEEVYSTWRFIERIEVGRLYLQEWKMLDNAEKSNLSDQQYKVMGALFPRVKTRTSMYERVRVMKSNSQVWKLMRTIDRMEKEYTLKGQSRPTDWDTDARRVKSLMLLLILNISLCYQIHFD
jgi:hypothetical protein